MNGEREALEEFGITKWFVHECRDVLTRYVDEQVNDCGCLATHDGLLHSDERPKHSDERPMGWAAPTGWLVPEAHEMFRRIEASAVSFVDLTSYESVRRAVAGILSSHPAIDMAAAAAAEPAPAAEPPAAEPPGGASGGASGCASGCASGRAA